MGTTETAVRWVLDTNYEDIPIEARQKVQEIGIDVLGCMLAGAAQEHGKIITDYSKELGGSAEAIVVATGQRTSAAQAAFVNGTLGHALDYDDMFGIAHSTTMLFPALLALGEKHGASGRDLIEAYVVGFEVGHALSRAYNQRLRFHKMSIFGRIGATLACAKLLKLNERQATMALGIGGSMASGLVHNFGSMTKPLHGGIAARDGVMAAEMALRGWTAGDRILEHPAGFMPAFCGEDVDAHATLAHLGNPYLIHNTIAIKRYPCGGGNHPTIDALLSLMAEHDFDYRDVEEVELQQSYESDYIHFAKPQTGLEGKFSLLYNAAATLVQKKIDIQTFTDERVKDPIINEVMDKVRVRVLSRWEVGLDKADQQWPKGQSSGFAFRPLTVRLKDGRVFVKNVLPSDLLGGPKNPWGFENIRKKFEANARLALPETKVQQASQVWSAMDSIKDLREAVACIVA